MKISKSGRICKWIGGGSYDDPLFRELDWLEFKLDLLRKWNDFIWPLEHLIQTAKRLIEWAPVLHKIHYYDWTGSMVVFQYQLGNIRKCLAASPFRCKSVRTKDIKVCELLIERLVKDDYMWNGPLSWDKLDKKWEFGSDNADTPEKKELLRKDLNWHMEHCNSQRQQDKDLLFKILNRKMDGWWN